MSEYGKLISRQRILIGLLKAVSGDPVSTSIVEREYQELHDALDREEQNITSRGLRPCDYLPEAKIIQENPFQEKQRLQKELDSLKDKFGILPLDFPT